MNKFEEPYWNPVDAITWIMYRDSALIIGSNLFNYATSLSIDIHLDDETTLYGVGPHIPYKNAMEQLMLELKKGTVKSFGLEFGKGDHLKVSPISWTRLSFRYDLNKAPWAEDVRPLKELIWEDIKIEKESVLAVWGNTPPKSSNEVELKISKEEIAVAQFEPPSLKHALGEEPDYMEWRSFTDYAHLNVAMCYALGIYFKYDLEGTRSGHREDDFIRLCKRASSSIISGDLKVIDRAGYNSVSVSEFYTWVKLQGVELSPKFLALDLSKNQVDNFDGNSQNSANIQEIKSKILELKQASAGGVAEIIARNEKIEEYEAQILELENKLKAKPTNNSSQKASEWVIYAIEKGRDVYNEHPKWSNEQIAKKVHEFMVKDNITGRGDRVPSIESISRRGLVGVKT
jgi:hypothetical protein